MEDSDEWADGEFVEAEYPLDRFAFSVSKWTLGGDFLWRNHGRLNDLADIVRYPKEATMPDNTDVTQYHIRSEKVCDIMCDVYKISTATFWVDPTTGLTLKCEVKGQSGEIDRSSSYEVTKLIIGQPNWDGKHLHPLSTDEIKLP